MLTVLVVVTHLGFLAWSGGTGILYGLFGDLHVLVVDGARSRWVDSRTRDVNLLPVRRDKLLAVDGDVVHDSASLVGGTVGRGIDGGASYVDLLAIVRLDPGAVLALSNVNGGAVGAVLSVNLNARFGVGRLRSGGKVRNALVRERTAFLMAAASSTLDRLGGALSSPRSAGVKADPS
jgi:hypothetical protein